MILGLGGLDRVEFNGVGWSEVGWGVCGVQCWGYMIFPGVSLGWIGLGGGVWAGSGMGSGGRACGVSLSRTKRTHLPCLQRCLAREVVGPEEYGRKGFLARVQCGSLLVQLRLRSKTSGQQREYKAVIHSTLFHFPTAHTEIRYETVVGPLARPRPSTKTGIVW